MDLVVGEKPDDLAAQGGSWRLEQSGGIRHAVLGLRQSPLDRHLYLCLDELLERAVL